MWSSNWLALDTETTGLDGTARIIEIGLVRFVDGVVKEEWSTLINPPNVDWNDPNVQRALEVNKIAYGDLDGQPSFDRVVEEILDRLSCDFVWVAHNADFDLRMLRQELSRLSDSSLQLPKTLVLDTMSLDHRLNPEAGVWRLNEVAKRWGVEPTDAHRAAADATTCGSILAEMVRAAKLPSNEAALQEMQKTATANWVNRPRRRGPR